MHTCILQDYCGFGMEDDGGFEQEDMSEGELMPDVVPLESSVPVNAVQTEVVLPIPGGAAPKLSTAEAPPVGATPGAPDVGETPRKRPRLNGKSPAATEESTSKDCKRTPEKSGPSAPMTHRAKRDTWLVHWIKERPSGFWKKGVTYRQKTFDAKQYWANLSSDKQKAAFFLAWNKITGVSAGEPGASSTQTPRKMTQADLTNMAQPTDRMHMGFLNSWNTPLLVVEPATMELFKNMRSLNRETEAFEDAVREVAKSPVIKHLWDTFSALLKEWSTEAEFTELSLGMEASLNSDDECRVHFHAMLSALQKKKSIALGPLANWKVAGVAPDVRPNTSKGVAATKAIQRGHAYCQAEKTGKLHAYTNHAAGEAFVLSATWIMEWWRLDKITVRAARREIVKNRHRVAGALRELEVWQEQSRTMMVKVEQGAVRSLLANAFKEFKEFEEIKRWLLQYNKEFYGVKSRFKFLVLVGESCLGKTQLALSLFGNQCTYIANCQNVDEPNLLGFDRYEHKAVIFDEATPTMVVQNKVLFQAGSEGVQMCQSKCQQFAMFRWLYQVPLIVSCNAWVEEMEGPEGDIAWLNANSVVIVVEEEVWKK